MAIVMVIVKAIQIRIEGQTDPPKQGFHPPWESITTTIISMIIIIVIIIIIIIIIIISITPKCIRNVVIAINITSTMLMSANMSMTMI